ncbi:hypothetical protein EYC84_000611 [Monilinia fructicola]|uniref:Transmembrane protein n=1 Tax=Monilinia fructicola TaxID=38448 RepID=A0A5M9JP49_MONFR|nr:hypothetical protein EYC84_000611 [Monilinia fructicola]
MSASQSISQSNRLDHSKINQLINQFLILSFINFWISILILVLSKALSTLPFLTQPYLITQPHLTFNTNNLFLFTRTTPCRAFQFSLNQHFEIEKHSKLFSGEPHELMIIA